MISQLTQKKVSFWPVLLAIGVGNFVAALSSTTVTIMLPVFMKEFSADIVTVQWVLTGYMLASGIVAPLIGYLADRLSPKRTYLFSILGFSLMSLLAGLSQSITMLIVCRILQGCFGGMILPLTMSLVFQIIEPERQAFALSIWSISGILAPTLGPTVAGILTDAMGWQWVFYLVIPVAAVAFLAALRYIPYYTIPQDGKNKFDYVGLFSAIVGTYCLLYVFSNLSRWEFFSLKCLGLLTIGIVTTAYFVYHELHCDAPLLNLNVLRYNNFAWSVVVLCVAQVVMNTSIVVMPIYLQDVLGYSTTIAALTLSLGPFCGFFLVPVIGIMYHRINTKRLLYTMLLIGGTGMILHQQLTLTTTAVFAAIAVLVRDLGVGSIMMPATNMGMQSLPPEVSSHASATSSWVRQCVVSLAIGLINTFLTIRTNTYLGQNNSIADQVLRYNTSYTMAMHDLFTVVLVVVVFGLFAVSRMQYKNKY